MTTSSRDQAPAGAPGQGGSIDRFCDCPPTGRQELGPKTWVDLYPAHRGVACLGGTIWMCTGCGASRFEAADAGERRDAQLATEDDRTP